MLPCIDADPHIVRPGLAHRLVTKNAPVISTRAFLLWSARVWLDGTKKSVAVTLPPTVASNHNVTDNTLHKE